VNLGQFDGDPTDTRGRCYSCDFREIASDFAAFGIPLQFAPFLGDICYWCEEWLRRATKESEDGLMLVLHPVAVGENTSGSSEVACPLCYHRVYRGFSSRLERSVRDLGSAAFGETACPACAEWVERCMAKNQSPRLVSGEEAG
jgi:hypothetical protein